MVNIPNQENPSLPMPPAHKPDYGLYVGILFGIVSVFFFVLQSNGVEVNWLWSVFIYAACTVGAVWTTLKHALPDGGRGKRIVVVTPIVLICAILGSIGTIKQYQKDHPARPAVPAAPKAEDQDTGGKVIMTGWGGMPGGKVFANVTVESPPAPSLHLHMILIARVQDSAIDEMEDTRIERSSLRDVVGQTIEITVSREFQARAYRLKFAKVILVLLPGTVQPDQISKLSDVLRVGGTIMINNGFVWPVIAQSKPTAGNGTHAMDPHSKAGGEQQRCETGSLCNQDSQVNAPQTVNNYAPPQRQLTAGERDRFIAYLRPHCPFEAVVRPIPGNAESMEYANQIAQAIKDAGCTIGRTPWLLDNSASYGIDIAIHDIKEIPPGADALAGAFVEAGIKFRSVAGEPVVPKAIYVMVNLNDSKPPQ